MRTPTVPAVEKQDEERERASALDRRRGLVHARERVWREGVDVTHEPPSTWEWPYSDYIAGKRGEAIRERYLQAHAEHGLGTV